MKHWHHIVPKHIGGSDEPSNLVHLTVEEHAEEHRKLWEQYGRWQDKIAWKTLSGQISIQEAREKMMRIDNPMKNPEVVIKMSGDNHWSKRPGKIHNAKVDHPKGSSKKVTVNGKIYNSIKDASVDLNMGYRKIKKIGQFK